MNARRILTAAALVAAATGAFAAEGEQWVPQTGSLTRAEVRAELARAQAAGEIAAVSATYGSFAQAVKTADYAAPAVDRAEVRAAARSRPAFDDRYIGG